MDEDIVMIKKKKGGEIQETNLAAILLRWQPQFSTLYQNEWALHNWFQHTSSLRSKLLQPRTY